MTTTKQVFEAAFEKFMTDGDPGQAIIDSTTASWGGGEYVVELFEDGNFRTLWSGSIGNRYETPGMLVSIPTLDETETDGLDSSDWYVEQALEDLRTAFDDQCAEIDAMQAEYAEVFGGE